MSAVKHLLGSVWIQDRYQGKTSDKKRDTLRRLFRMRPVRICSSVHFPSQIDSSRAMPQERLGWDDEIPADDQERWQTWLKELPKLEELTIERCFKPTNFSKIKSSQLHHFSDTSQQGYGAVTYLRIDDDDPGRVHCSFVMGKSRLAPLKPVTIPRMELSAAVVATRLDRITRQDMILPVDQSYF